ncbi:ABC transporter ATP-binding protein, partial [Enterococcus faecalis]|nr:ABC transporter ATP-binding protein [Enterococcus faecalis]
MLKFLFSKNRKLFLATFLMTLLFATYKPIFSLLILFDSNYIKQEQTLPFYILVCINLGILFSLVLINLGSQIVQQHFFASSLKKMNNQMYQALIRLPLATLIKKYPTEKVVKIMTIDNPFVIKKYLGALISLIYFICSFSLGSLLILTINWHIWLYLLALTLISFFTTKQFVKKIAIHQKKFNDSQANIVQTLQDIFEDLAVLKNFSIGKRLFPRFSQKNKEAEKHFFKNNFFQS